MSDFAPSGFFLLRAPLLSFDELSNLATPPISIRERLLAWLQRPVTREALWLASPDLLVSLDPWLAELGSPKGRKLERALYRYFARMTARATPFGGFAACTLGALSGDTRLALSAQPLCTRRTRLDMEFLCGIAASASLDPILRAHVVFRPNDTLHCAAGNYHHLRRTHADEAAWRLVATSPSTALDSTLALAASGATAHSLAAALVANAPGITLEDAEDFLSVLIDSQLLVSSLTPPVSGPDPAEYLVAQLELARLSDLAARLRALLSDLAVVDSGGPGAPLDAHLEIERHAADLPGGFRSGRLLQLDLFRPAECATLSASLADEVLRAVSVLQSLQPAPDPPPLQRFAADLFARYGDGEVALLEALDDEIGIGFESESNPSAEPLLDSIDLAPAPPGPAAAASSSPLATRLAELAATGATVLALDDALLRELAAPAPLPLPDAFSVIGSCFVLPDGLQGFCLDSATGPAGANLMARFCHLDARLTSLVRDHLRAEESLQPSLAICAEIVHLPEPRTGNVLCRPALRDYEIPFFTSPGLPPERQLPLSDLTLSLRSGRVVLRSSRLGCEVVARLASAHDFTLPSCLKLYKFLCLLQSQNHAASVSWDWGALASSAFLPRVILGNGLENVALEPASWNIDSATTQRLAHAPPASRLEGLATWRAVQRVPRFAAIAESDNHLMIDFDNPLAVDVFLDHVAHHDSTRLVEMYPPPDALAASTPDGRCVHEIVLPFVRRAAVPAPGPAPVPVPLVAAEVATSPEPDSDWLYARLFCGPFLADQLLLDLVQPFVAEILDAGLIDRWFFIRYDMPHWHLRLRFHGEPSVLNTRVRPLFCQLAGEQNSRGALWRFDFERYEPETERYGGSRALLLAERLFHSDSTLCLDLLRFATEPDRPHLRWQLAICALDSLFTSLGFTLDEKRSLAADMARSRFEDFTLDLDTKRQLSTAFRLHRDVLTRLLQRNADESTHKNDLLPPSAREALARFSTDLQPLCAEYHLLAHSGVLATPLRELAWSFAHMHLNRLLRSRHDEYEAVLCDLLARTYASALARGRQQG